MKPIRVVLVAAAAAALTACGQEGSSTPPQVAPSSTPVAVATPAPTPTAFVLFSRTHAMTPSPAKLTVTVGTTVKFYSDIDTIKLCGDLSSPTFATGGYLMTFTQAGTFHYLSCFHAGSTGVVIVR